ncbi:hypothetical protein JM93_00984 [Roseibium hamelinense]|uniref:Uncharacterized protein n=1 Tax=Roseibium hamelinense TaxID=150831 RepID=A0A562TID4_9HYPH|nr:hypothetical protein [Roseibium hamelinense]TWI93427.1 hypothetical protein JM93_00984 [Roseibium hamelinense]
MLVKATGGMSKPVNHGSKVPAVLFVIVKNLLFWGAIAVSLYVLFLMVTFAAHSVGPV